MYLFFSESDYFLDRLTLDLEDQILLIVTVVTVTGKPL